MTADNDRMRPRWYALYTRARHEKKVQARLEAQGFEVFLPLVPRERKWHDRTKIVDWPLFPSYVFARFRVDSAARVLGTAGVAAVVRMNGWPAPVPDEEIENVRRFAAALAESGGAPDPEPLVQVEEGEGVRIVAGPFQGVAGVVVERRGRSRALVQVGLPVIGQGVKLELDVAALKPSRASLAVG